jgi:quinol-cytochrome oxidoreductase complex cytochrome b subunit
MKLIGYFLLACIVLAVAQAAAVVLALLVVLAIIYGVFTAPRELFGLLGLLLVAAAFQAHPFVCLSVAGVTAVANLLRAR